MDLLAAAGRFDKAGAEQEAQRVLGGVRHDEYSSSGGSTNPRLAAIYDVFTETTLKLIATDKAA